MKPNYLTSKCVATGSHVVNRPTNVSVATGGHVIDYLTNIGMITTSFYHGLPDQYKCEKLATTS